MNTVVDSSKECRAQASKRTNGVKYRRILPVAISCLLTLPWVVAFGQSSPHAQAAASVGEAKPAQVTYEHGRLTVNANGSSLSKILEQIQDKMGIVIEGNVLHNPVMGQYGPGYPRVVLKKLLEASSYQYKMVSDGTPYSVTRVILSLRSNATAEKSAEPAAAPAAPAAATASTVPGATAATAATVKSGSNEATAATPYVVQSPGAAAAATGPTKTVPLVASPDGSPYLKGSNISVRQLQKRTADEEKRRSEQLTKESQEKPADDGSK